MRGVISDASTGTPVAGATVVVTGPELQGAQTYITEGDGQYIITNLNPGTYLVTVYYLEAETRRSNARVQLGKVAVINVKIKTDAQSGEVIEIVGRAPIIDQGSTKTGQTITPDYTENIPTGRTFGGVLGTAAGSQNDIYGVSFGGSTSAENTYIVEGINTTDPAFGLQSTNLPNEFVRETELITGGYNAEYGRSTGAVINVLTKSGGNEFHGSVFTYFTPGSLTAERLTTPSAASAIELNSQLDYTWSLGAELGGPIIKDKLWFHFGINPTFNRSNLDRIVNRNFDDGNGNPEVDANGFNVVEEVGRYSTTTGGRGPANLRDTFFTLKLSGAVSPDHQGSFSFLGNPRQTEGYTTLTGHPDAGRSNFDSGAFDFSFKWTSKLNNNKTQIDLVAGYHQNVAKTLLPDDAPLADTPQLRNDFAQSLDIPEYEAIEMEYFGGVPDACRKADPLDPNEFTPCPARFYNLAGHGFRDTQTTNRISALLSVTQRVKLAGQHTFKAGIDFEDQNYDHLSDFTGGARYRNLGSFWRSDRYYAPDPMGEFGRSYQPDGLLRNTNTTNFGAYLQDSWAILPNLTFNAGIRWEQQVLEISDQLKAQSDACLEAATGAESLLCADGEAFALRGMFAPRLGIIYDPTQEGRSKINAHWGRFYESIPMDINSRAFGGEIFNVRLFFECGDNNTGAIVGDPQCNDEPTLADGSANPNVPVDLYFGGGEEGVVPGLKGQYLDEFVIGGEYELLNDFKVGASYIHRELGRVIEDVSTDGANTYIVANPGEIDEAGVNDYIDSRQPLVDEGVINPATGQPFTMEDLETERQMLLAAGDFDKPVRRYDALQITAEKRVTKNLMFIGNYTYSHTYGNFPGLFSPETGQLDPNLTSMYDLPELMANRTGILAADRPHLFKLDGYYQADLKEAGIFGVGASIRATSGIPHNVLGSHPLYGFGESYILPRGTWQRSPLFTSFDLQLQYGRRLNKNMRLSAFVRVFNLFNQQTPLDIQELYTLQDVNPCVGCDLDDLPHVKSLDGTTGLDTSGTLVQDPNFGNTTQRQGPRSVTLGARLTF